MNFKIVACNIAKPLSKKFLNGLKTSPKNIDGHMIKTREAELFSVIPYSDLREYKEFAWEIPLEALKQLFLPILKILFEEKIRFLQVCRKILSNPNVKIF